MDTYEAYVRINGYYIRTRVIASDAYAARLLLMAQYGEDSIANGPSMVTSG